MSRIMLGRDMRDLLSQLYYPVELCDETGAVLGCFVPNADMKDYEALTPEISEEELERRRKSNERCYSTAEVIAHLESLDVPR